jgi:membrane-associated protein
MQFLIDLFLNLDVVLQSWVTQYGVLIYVLLFLIIFLETGVVVTPFLPGDSLLFAGGAIAAISGGGLNIWALYAVVFAAAVVGDFANYWIGRVWGRRILDSGRVSRVVKPEYIASTEAFFERHGGKTISLARFFPFIRTFAPFVAGISRMHLQRFVAFNVIGAAAWVGLFVTAGYLFGNIPFIAHNLQYLVIGIVLLSVLPAFYHFVRRRISRSLKAGQVPVGGDDERMGEQL